MGHVATLWNWGLTLVSLLNVVILLGWKRPVEPSRRVSSGHWTSSLWPHRRWLVLIYVVACGIRATWPRHDSSKLCFVDNTISLVVVGRSLATVAEISFAALVSMAVSRVTQRQTLASFWTAINFVAQTCCWYSVITENQLGHVIEESIWLCTGATIVVVCSLALLKFKYAPTPTQAQKDTLTFLRSMVFGGIIYVAFMFFVDVPMYWNRYQLDTAEGKIYSTLAGGFKDTFECKIVSQDDAFWIEEMPWMSAYFTFAVWFSLWLLSVQF